MPTLYKWGVACQTENVVHYVWTESNTVAPTACPVNSAHTIFDDVVVCDTQADGTVRIAQENVPTNNRIRSETFCSATVAAGATHVHTAMWKKYTTNVKTVVVRGQLGDTVTLSFGEDTTVGVIGAVTANGATTLAFDMTPFPMMISGSEVRLVDGNGASAYMEIANIAAGTVTLQNATEREFAAGAYVQVREVAASGYIMENDVVDFGSGSFTAALFPANTVCTFRYTNHGASPVYVLCNAHFWR